MLQSKAEAEADAILTPYLAVIRAEPEPWWSEMTKLQFRLRQVSVAEKLLDRVFGRPIRRDQQAQLDAATADELDDLQLEVVVQMVAILAQRSEDDAASPA